MAAPYVEQLRLTLVNNEALAEPVVLTQTVGGVTTPLDLTGCVFKSQVKKKRGLEEPIVLELDVVVTDAAQGVIEFRYPEADANDAPPGNYLYDVLMSTDGADPDNLWSSDFIIEKGVTKW